MLIPPGNQSAPSSSESNAACAHKCAAEMAILVTVSMIAVQIWIHGDRSIAVKTDSRSTDYYRSEQRLTVPSAYCSERFTTRITAALVTGNRILSRADYSRPAILSGCILKPDLRSTA